MKSLMMLHLLYLIALPSAVGLLMYLAWMTRHDA
jgi:hypothetical protein